MQNHIFYRIRKLFIFVFWMAILLCVPNAYAGGSDSESIRPKPVEAGFNSSVVEPGSFEWKDALKDASFFLGIEHAVRLASDPNVRNGLRGPFFGDYVQSVENIKGWGDGDGWVTNYLGHPMSGSITGFIEAQHDPRFRNVEFGMAGDYWKSRARAMVFSAAYSLQFEIGPISEASIGNTQLNPRARGVVDWVVTPTVGTAWMVMEDMVDKYAIHAIERRTGNRAILILARSLMNPTRATGNILGHRRPWQRDDRPGINFIKASRAQH